MKNEINFPKMSAKEFSEQTRKLRKGLDMAKEKYPNGLFLELPTGEVINVFDGETEKLIALAEQIDRETS